MDCHNHPLPVDDVLAFLQDPTGFLSEVATVETPPRGVNDQTPLSPDAEFIVKVRPHGDESCLISGSRWPAHTCALFGDIPSGGVRSLMRVTAILHHHGGLPVPSILHYGEGNGPGGSDLMIGEILPGRPFDGEANRMGPVAARQLGDHLGRLHTATVRTNGFGVLDGEPIRRTQWWSRFEASYTILADAVCESSPFLRTFRRQLDVPLRQAMHSPDPREFPLVCIDQDPGHYLGDERGSITGFVDVERHLFAPAEWELAALLMWMPHPHYFRHGYQHHRHWPQSMDDVRDAYATYTLMEWLLRARDLTERPERSRALEARLIETLASPSSTSNAMRLLAEE